MLERENFPKNFLFGTATSAYQIEGAANSYGRVPSIWDDFSKTPGKIADSSNGDIACDHYHLYETDLDLIKNIGLDSYRFSISWPRVISNRRGKINQEGLDFYDRLVDQMLKRDIDPFLTLYHWDLPSFLQEIGGWTNRDTNKHFRDYAYTVSEKLGDRVKNWITHNEMWCTSFLSHHIGMFAPGEQNLKNGFTVAHNLLLSHGLATKSLREHSNSLKIGIAPNYLPCYPATESKLDRKAAELYDGYFNRWFLDPLSGKDYPEVVLEVVEDFMPKIETGDMETIKQECDFIGINYYNANWYKYDETIPLLPCKKVQPDNLWFTADRDVYAKGLYDTLDRVNKDYNFKDIYITENGAAFDDKLEIDSNGNKVCHDQGRVRFYKEHFEQASLAIKDGIPLKGYFVWSLLDNFEWAAGYTLRYGMHYTDYNTQERIPKDSAKWLKDFIHN